MGKKRNLINQQFERLVVKEEIAKRDASGGVMWLCQCECGNTIEVRGSSLVSGHTKSCGCLQKEKAQQIGRNNLNDLTNLTFGKLQVLKRGKTIKTPNGSTRVFWICKCECGNIIEVCGNSLTSNNTTSCGCLRSKGEEIIGKLLATNNIPYTKEYIFKNCVSVAGGECRFDFFVNNQYVIEFDGKQHFSCNNVGWNDQNSYNRTVANDKIKNEYCWSHNIPIIRIPYTHLNQLTIQDLIIETSTFVIRKDNNEEV